LHDGRRFAGRFALAYSLVVRGLDPRMTSEKDLS
jgi:hypothetical protein